MEGDYQITVQDWIVYIKMQLEFLNKTMLHVETMFIPVFTLLTVSVVSIYNGFLIPLAIIGLIFSSLLLLYLILLITIKIKLFVIIGKFYSDIIEKKFDSIDEIRSKFYEIQPGSFMDILKTPISD